MTPMLHSRERPANGLSPLAAAVMATAAAGLAVVLAPRSVVEAAGLLALRTAYDHAFGLVVLVLTAWGSWILGGHLAAYHGRRAFLKTLPAVWEGLSPWQLECAAACLAAPGHTIRASSHDIAARSLCDLGLVMPPPDDPGGRLRLDAPYTMPADVADTLRAYLAARRAGR